MKNFQSKSKNFTYGPIVMKMLKNIFVFGCLFITSIYTTKAQTPGGVSSTLSYWVKADVGITEVGGQVTQWNDQSGNVNITSQASIVASPDILFEATIANFNPSLQFTGVLEKRLVGATVDDTEWNGALTVFALAKWKDGVNPSTEGVWTSGQKGILTTTTTSRYYCAYGTASFLDNSANTLDDIFEYKVLSVTYTANHTDGTNIYDKGLLAENHVGPGGVAAAPANVFNVGGTTTGAVEDGIFNGLIPEIIVYKSVLSATDRQKVESYMALKYGVTLSSGNIDYLASDGTDKIWDTSGSGVFKNNIFGIGRDDASGLDQRISKSVNDDAIVTVATTGNFILANTDVSRTSLTDMNFLTIANNGDNDRYDNFVGVATNAKMNRVWKVQETGTIGAIFINTDDATATHILISNDATFDNTDTEIALADGTALVDFTDGQYFTYTSTVKAPGGVIANNMLWLKADEGTVLDGSDVSTWTDNSIETNDVSEATNKPVIIANGENFNPSISFDGVNDILRMSNKNILTDKTGLNAYIVADIIGTNSNGNLLTEQKFGASNRVFGIGAFNSSPEKMGTLGDFGASGSSSLSVVQAVSNTGQGRIYQSRIDDSADMLRFLVDGIEEGTAPGLTTTRTPPTGSLLFSIGNSAFGMNPIEANISEVIVYDIDDATGIERQKIESYLALKYGITLNNGTKNYLASDGTDKIWDAAYDLTYVTNVFGIGRDDNSALGQVKSTSINDDAIVTIEADGEGSNAANAFVDISDLEFLTIAHNNAALGVWNTTGAPTALKKIDRTWQVQEEGDVGLVSIEFNVDNAAGNFDIPALEGGSSYYFLYDINDNNSLSDDSPIKMTETGPGLWKVSGINLANGMEFTIATALPVQIELEAATGTDEEESSSNLPNLLLNGTVFAPTAIDIIVTGTALPGTDYTLGDLSAGGTITVDIPAGIYTTAAPLAISSLNKTTTTTSVNFAITADSTVENNETISLVIGNPQGQLVLADTNAGSLITNHTYTIIDDDADITNLGTKLEATDNTGETSTPNSAALRVTLLNKDSTPISGVNVQFSVATGSATLSTANGITNGSGQFSTFVSNLVAEAATFTVNYDSNDDTTPNALVTNGNLSTITFTITSASALAEVLEDSASTGGANNANGVAVSEAHLLAIAGLFDVYTSNVSLYQTAIHEETSFSSPPTVSEVQDVIDGVNDAVTLLTAIGTDEDDGAATTTTPSASELNAIIGVTGAVFANQSAYQDYINANENNFSLIALALEVQIMVTDVNNSVVLLEAIGIDEEDGGVTTTNPTAIQLNTIIGVSGALLANQTSYQEYIGLNESNFSSPALASEVQTMVTNVNSSIVLLTAIGIDEEDGAATTTNATAFQLNAIIGVSGAIYVNQTSYQEYINANESNFSAVALASEVQIMITDVNNSMVLLTAIGIDEGDGGATTTNATAIQLNTIIGVSGALSANQTSYQEYINANESNFSSPALASEVQIMVTDVNSSVLLLVAIGNDEEDGVATTTNATSYELNLVIGVSGAIVANEIYYQDYIDANENNFSSSALASEVQTMITTVNSSVLLLTAIGIDEEDGIATTTNATATGLNAISGVTGALGANVAYYQKYIDGNNDNFSPVATSVEVQIMITDVNACVVALIEILEDSASTDGANNTNGIAVTLEQLNAIFDVTGIDNNKITGYQSKIHEETTFSNLPTIPEVQAIIDAVNTVITVTVYDKILEDSNSTGGGNNVDGIAVTVAELSSISGITAVDSSFENQYQLFIANETSFSNPPSLLEVQSLVTTVNVLMEVLEDSNAPNGAQNANGTQVTLSQLEGVNGITSLEAANIIAYQTAIAAETTFSDPPTVAELQTLIDAVNAEVIATVFDKILEDSASSGGSNNADGIAVTVAELSSIPGITAIDSNFENQYQLFIANETAFSNPPTLSEVQAIIDAVNVAENDKEILISNSLSPIDKKWVIGKIEKHPNNKVQVFNKWGKNVFTASGYNNTWTGTNNGSGSTLLPEGSYYYLIDLDGDGSIEKQGWIYISK